MTKQKIDYSNWLLVEGFNDLNAVEGIVREHPDWGKTKGSASHLLAPVLGSPAVRPVIVVRRPKVPTVSPARNACQIQPSCSKDSTRSQVRSGS